MATFEILDKTLLSVAYNPAMRPTRTRATSFMLKLINYYALVPLLIMKNE
jgi:hypothetical protein